MARTDHQLRGPAQLLGVELTQVQSAMGAKRLKLIQPRGILAGIGTAKGQTTASQNDGRPTARLPRPTMIRCCPCNLK